MNDRRSFEMTEVARLSVVPESAAAPIARVHVKGKRLSVGLVGPLPPPAGGMAVQCQQLRGLLEAENIAVTLVQTNADYRPAWIRHLRVVRSVFRLLPYLRDLWRMAGAVDLIHVMANSGWAWHLFAAPAVWIGRWRRVPVIVNYRGGDAQSFLRRAPRWVRSTLLAADARITPSEFLREVFAGCGIPAEVIPNVIDLSLFHPRHVRRTESGAHIVVTRNLEGIYDVGNAIRAFALVSARAESARLTIAGEGPELSRLQQIASELGVAEKVRFAGRLDRAAIAELYRDADLMLNPSTVDNMPNAILEAYASGVPVVTTDAGGIPYIARHEQTALLVPVRDPHAMANAACAVLEDRALAQALLTQGLAEARRYTWSEVRLSWLGLYESLVKSRAVMT